MQSEHYRQKLIAEARAMPLMELFDMVTIGSHTPMIHLGVLRERIQALEETYKNAHVEDKTPA